MSLELASTIQIKVNKDFVNAVIQDFNKRIDSNNADLSYDLIFIRETFEESLDITSTKAIEEMYRLNSKLNSKKENVISSEEEPKEFKNYCKIVRYKSIGVQLAVTSENAKQLNISSELRYAIGYYDTERNHILIKFKREINGEDKARVMKKVSKTGHGFIITISSVAKKASLVLGINRPLHYPISYDIETETMIVDLNETVE